MKKRFSSLFQLWLGNVSSTCLEVVFDFMYKFVSRRNHISLYIMYLMEIYKFVYLFMCYHFIVKFICLLPTEAPGQLHEYIIPSVTIKQPLVVIYDVEQSHT